MPAIAKKALQVGIGLIGKLLGKKPQQQQQEEDDGDETEVYIIIFGAGLLGVIVLYLLLKLIFKLIF